MTLSSHAKYNLRRNGTKISFYAAIFAVFLALFTFTPMSAAAATARQAAVHKIDFNDTTQQQTRTLDWRSPSAVLTFDVPDNDWVDDVELLFSARSIGTVSQDAPLLVRFNDAEPVPLQTGGNGFDARIRLDRLRLRKERNQISFEYQVPAGEACIGPGHGAWDIDTIASFVVIKSRTKSRPLNFHDVKVRLGASATTPKSVALLAKGPDALKLQALASQGIMQNISHVPNFRTKAGSADLEIIMAPRHQLGAWVSGIDIFKNSGPTITIGRSRPLQIVLTGDTDAEVMSAVKAFSNFPIPLSHNRNLSPTRFINTAPLLHRTKRIEGKTLLSELGGVQFGPDWAPGLQTMKFDIADPAASFGRVSLALRAGPLVDPASKITAALNGQILETVWIDRTRMTANFDIPRGVLRGLGNQLTLAADLKPSAGQPICAATRIGPGFSVGPKSYIRIRSDFESDSTDLSRFSASGLPFAKQNGAGTQVIFATENTAEQQAAFRLLAQLGLASKSGWTEAVFTYGNTSAQHNTHNTLMIGSQINMAAATLSGAPRGLKVAIGGVVTQEPLTTKSASNIAALPSLLAAQTPVEGGVAALYRDRENPEKLIGVITQTRGQSFVRAVDNLLGSDHWNTLEGSVARWSRETVMMAQTAMPAPPKQSSKLMSFKPPSLKGFKLPDMTLPDVNFPDMSLPDIEPLTLSAQLNWDRFTAWTGQILSDDTGLVTPQPLDIPQNPALRPTDMQSTAFIPPVPSRKPETAVTKPRWTLKLPKLPERARNEAPKAAPSHTTHPQTPHLEMPHLETSELAAKELRQYPNSDDSGVIAQAGRGIAKAYTSASDHMTAAINHSPLGYYVKPSQNGAKWLLIAIIVILLLLGAALVRPSTVKATHH